MRTMILPVVAAVALATGCYTHGDVGVGYSYGYAAPAPSLHYVSPGVQVVAYSDYPVFYSDGYYWRYDGGLWYRSGYYNSGWTVSYNVPYGVRSIDRPHTYARFRPGQGWSRQPAYGGTYQSSGGVNVRDHRSGAYRTAPATRDHRSQPVYSPPATTTRSAPVYSPPARDHRSAPPAARPSSGPAVRDHRRR